MVIIPVVIILALDADKGDFGRLAGHVPVADDFQVVSVQREYFAGAGVGDKDATRRSGNVRPGPKAGINGIGKDARCGRQQIGVMGIVHPHFAVAHHHQQQFAVIAEGNLYRAQRFGSGDKLLHRTHFRLHQVQANARTQRKEMVQPVIAPDRGQPEIVRRAGRRRDESVGVFAVVRLNHHGPAGAAEHRHMAVAGVAVQIGAFGGGGVQRHAGLIADGDALRQAVFLRVGRIVRVLHRHGENIALQRHRRAMMGAGVELAGNIAVPIVFQFVFTDQRHIPRAVVVNGAPFLADVQVNGTVAGQVDIETPHVGFHQFGVVAVFLPVNAAVKNVGRVGVGGHGNGIASAARSVNPAGAGAHIKGILHHRTGFQVNDRQLAAFAIAHQQPAVRRRIIMVIVMAVVIMVVIRAGEGQFHQFHRIQTVGCYYLHGVGGCDVFKQILNLRGQAGAVADEYGGLGNPHAVLRGALPGMDVAAHRNQAEHRHPVAAHLPGQVGQDGVARHHIHLVVRFGAPRGHGGAGGRSRRRRGDGGGSGTGIGGGRWRCRRRTCGSGGRRGRETRLLPVPAGGQEKRPRQQQSGGARSYSDSQSGKGQSHRVIPPVPFRFTLFLRRRRVLRKRAPAVSMPGVNNAQ